MLVLIGIYMHPDGTQIIQAKLKKNKIMEVSLAQCIEPYLQSLKDYDVNFLKEMFENIKSLTKTFYEEFYIVLPDTMFLSIDCADFTNDDEYLSMIRERLQMEEDAIYTAFPIDCNTGVRNKRTSYVIKCDFVDALIQAAKESDVALVSVEPASFSYLRAVSSWREEHVMLEIYEDEATIVSFSPVAGLFRLDMPEISAHELSKNAVQANELISRALAQHDLVAERTFETLNVNIPIEILDDFDDIRAIPVLKDRLKDKKCFPKEIVQNLINKEEEPAWMIPLGTIMQVYADEDPLYETTPEFLHLQPANILPAKVKLDSRFQRIKKIAKKYSRIAIMCLIGISLVELVGVIYYGNIEIPDKLQADYDQAQAKIKDIDAEINLVKTAKAEHEYPMEALTELITQKPQALGFRSIAIGSGGQSKEDKSKWVECVVQTADPLVFRDYANVLSVDEMFKGVNINQISSNAGVKIATIYIGKGKVE